MAYYEDLSTYQYSGPPTGLPGVYNVGWLAASNPFAPGRLDDETVARIREISEAGTGIHYFGSHSCEFCSKAEPAQSCMETWIRSGDVGIFASPSMLGHYVSTHAYVPPRPYLDAIASQNLEILDYEQCYSMINRQQQKLEDNPTPEDMIYPYYRVEVYWKTELFPDLMAFRDHCEGMGIAATHIARRESGFCVVEDGYEPQAILEETRKKYQDRRWAPYACHYRMQYLNLDEGQCLART